MIDQGASEEILTNETESTPIEQVEKEFMPKIEDEDEDDFKGYSKFSKFLLFFLFFWIGIINHLGNILVMNGGRLLAIELKMRNYLQVYTSVSTIFSVLTRLINSKLCLKVSYKKRIFFLCFWMMAGYLSMFAILELHGSILEGHNILCFILSFIPCFFLGSSYAFGEAAMIAYLRLFPKTLLAGWSSGTGLSGLISGGLNLTSQMIDGFSLKYLYLILSPVGIVYVLLFICTFRILKSQERRIEREERLLHEHMPIMKETSNTNEEQNDDNRKPNEVGETVEKEQNIEEQDKEQGINDDNENKEIEEDQKSIREEEDKEMEEMNKANQIISCNNFLRVMQMVGRVIINLGLIYFLMFFGTGTLMVRICDKEDIKFLPKGCSANGHIFRRGKYEFINLSYQIGMFLSKTFIKIVRRIKPIEIYTSVIAIINIIFIIEYFTGFLHWSAYLFLGLLFGFFSGGTYAVGFYTILNSDKVKQNYKELSINIATIFNDTGSFLSGILGFITYKYILNSDEPFGEKLTGECSR